ncbi:MAG: aminotransferase class V-fold PLP-dependent enzyme [Vicinamibacterales bacterium]
MSLSRRELLAGTAQLAVAAALPAADGVLPARGDFAIPAGQTYLNSAFIHPVPQVAAEAMRRYIDTRTFSRSRWSGDELAAKVRAQFAALINASPAEISLVESTSRGENIVVNGLGVPSNSGNVVTDALHFEGSLILYGELQRRGLDVRLVRPRDWRIDLSDLEKVVDRKTRLVAVSLVSWYNGFQHDLKRLCDLAHSYGAYLYADIVQAAGNTPIDVRASGVDFCACSSFKWLMGDFGLGFLYVREALLDRVIHRSEYGYQQADTVMHYLPSDPPASTPVTWSMQGDARGHFQVGTYGQGALNALAESLALLQRIGVERIHAQRQPLLRRLHEEMPKLGFTPITPADTTSAIVAFTARNAEQRLAARLKQADVSVTLSGERMRISPSFFNDVRDVDRLLNALA